MPFAPKYPKSINDPSPYFTVATVLFSRKIQLTCLQAWRWWLWSYSYIFVSSDSRERIYESSLLKKVLGSKEKKYSCMVKISNAASEGKSTWISERTKQLQWWNMVVAHWCFGDIWVQIAYVNQVNIDGKLNVNVIRRFRRRIFMNHHKNWEWDANGCSNGTTV